MEKTETNTWHVDERCLNCNVARQLAPGLIGIEPGGARGRHSVMIRQPRNEEEVGQLYAAAYACPTRSVHPPAGRLDPARDPYPIALTDEVYLCGHTSARTYGATSYLLRRPDGTAMMVDTPRWSAALADRYETFGPVTDVLLTHRDHVAHGRRYADRFAARLWIHEGDLDSCPDADRILRGTDPVEIGEGVVAHPLPGHTEGSVVYLADELYCFTGDSVYWSRTTDDLEVFESVVFHSAPTLAASLTRLAGTLRFEWVLPGHGALCHRSAEEMARRLTALADRARALPERPVDFTAIRW